MIQPTSSAEKIRFVIKPVHYRDETISHVAVVGAASGQAVTFAHFFATLQASDEAMVDFKDALSGHPDGMFFECPPVTAATWNTLPFEFVLIPRADAFAGMTLDIVSFASHFADARANGQTVAAFDSMGKDARLVAPCNRGSIGWAHLSEFVHRADGKLFAALWRRVGAELHTRLTAGVNGTTDLAGMLPLWLSTSGLGVSWLHVRIDSRPKYYQFRPFKTT